MKSKSDLLKSVARVFVKYGGNVVGGGIAGNIIIDVWDGWEKMKKSEAERKAELEALAKEPTAQLNADVAQVVREVARDQPPEVQQALKQYLHQIPAMVRRSLKRPADLRGVSVPADLRLSSAQDLAGLLPTQLPRFQPGQRPLPGVDLELLEPLGVGGFGEVWKAKNPLLPNARPVALKFCLDPAAAALLRHEAAMLDRAMRLGKEPGIIRLLHTYLSVNPPCLEYEFVAGGDLTGLIHEWHHGGKKVSAAKVARVTLRLARIVGAAHKEGIVHRDLKPANILLQIQDGKMQLKVADFGIGGVAVHKAIQDAAPGKKEATVAGVRGAYTPLYASPQQMRGEPADPRDDVYSLGVIWYQLMTGNLGAGAPTGRAWQKRLTEQGMSREMRALMEACFEQEPDHRPANATALADRLEPLLGGAQTAEDAAPLTAPKAPPTPAPKRRNWRLLVAAGLVLAVLGGGAFYALKTWGTATPEPAPEAASCKLVFHTDERALRLTLMEQGKEVVSDTGEREVYVKPGDYEVHLAGARPGERPSRERVTVQPGDRELHLGVWQAGASWPAAALQASKIKAPTLPVSPLFTDDFQNPPATKKKFAERANATESVYTGGKYVIGFKQGGHSGRWYALPGTYSDFACQLSARVRDSTAWGLLIGGPTGAAAPCVVIKLKDNGALGIRPRYKESYGPLRNIHVEVQHAAIKPLTEVNKLLVVLRGRRLEVYVNGVAVCDPIVLALDLTPAYLHLYTEDGVAEFDSALVWSATGLPTPESRGALPTPGIPDEAWTDLFNGKDLSGWRLIVDPKDASSASQLFTVKDGIVRCRGVVDGYLRTDKEYGGYALKLQWRWGNKIFNKEGRRNSGVFVHLVGGDKVWPKCIEAQIGQRDSGDFCLNGGFVLAVDKARRDAGMPHRYFHRKDDSERPTGEWNQYEIICQDRNVKVVVNGVLQNEGSQAEVARGAIALQSAVGEIDFKDIKLKSLPK